MLVFLLSAIHRDMHYSHNVLIAASRVYILFIHINTIFETQSTLLYIPLYSELIFYTIFDQQFYTFSCKIF